MTEVFRGYSSRNTFLRDDVGGHNVLKEHTRLNEEFHTPTVKHRLKLYQELNILISSKDG